MMRLILKPLPDDLEGFYGSNKTTMPKRFLFGHPDLAAAIENVRKAGLDIAYSDIFRSAESSLARRREFEKLGGPQLAKRPGESPHNFGFSVDVVVDRAMKKNNMSKAQLDAALESCGLYCHRKDHELGNESWHYNALGPDAQQWLRFASANSTSRAVEAKLMSVYSAQMVLTQQEVAQCLAQLKYKAVKEFQADWDLQADGIAGPVTQRLLAYLSAEIVLVS